MLISSATISIIMNIGFFPPEFRIIYFGKFPEIDLYTGVRKRLTVFLPGTIRLSCFTSKSSNSFPRKT